MSLLKINLNFEKIDLPFFVDDPFLLGETGHERRVEHNLSETELNDRKYWLG